MTQLYQEIKELDLQHAKNARQIVEAERTITETRINGYLREANRQNALKTCELFLEEISQVPNIENKYLGIVQSTLNSLANELQKEKPSAEIIKKHYVDLNAHHRFFNLERDNSNARSNELDQQAQSAVERLSFCGPTQDKGNPFTNAKISGNLLGLEQKHNAAIHEIQGIFSRNITKLQSSLGGFIETGTEQAR